MNNFNQKKIDDTLEEIFQGNQCEKLMPLIQSELNSLPLFDQRIEFAQEVLDEINIKLDPIFLKTNPLELEQIKVLDKVRDFLRNGIIFLNINLQTVYMAILVEELIGKKLRNQQSENSIEKVS